MRILNVFVLNVLVCAAVAMMAGCDYYPKPVTVVYRCEDTGVLPFTIEGNATYNQTMVAGAEVFLVNSGNIAVDQVKTNYAGYYLLSTDEAGSYTLLDAS